MWPKQLLYSWKKNWWGQKVKSNVKGTESINAIWINIFINSLKIGIGCISSNLIVSILF